MGSDWAWRNLVAPQTLLPVIVMVAGFYTYTVTSTRTSATTDQQTKDELSSHDNSIRSLSSALQNHMQADEELKVQFGTITQKLTDHDDALQALQDGQNALLQTFHVNIPTRRSHGN